MISRNEMLGLNSQAREETDKTSLLERVAVPLISAFLGGSAVDSKTDVVVPQQPNPVVNVDVRVPDLPVSPLPVVNMFLINNNQVGVSYAKKKDANKSSSAWISRFSSVWAR